MASNDGHLTDDGELLKEKLLALLESHLPDKVMAKALLEAATKDAIEQDKRIIVQETAMWCEPCHLLTRFLKENPVWQEDFVLVKTDHRFEGAREIMQEIRAGAGGGIPRYAILDEKGKPLVTSNRPEDEDNIGYPSSETGIAHFKSMLMQTRKRLTEVQIESLAQKLAE